MPLVAHNDLPTFQRLSKDGSPIMPMGRALSQDIRELHVGLLNIMPDAALEATERQFFRLIGESNRVAQIYLHPFTLPIFERSKDAQSHIDKYYETFEDIKAQGLDALIISGANEETNPHVSDESIWAPLKEALEWAFENVTSTLCSCLASHALLTYMYDQQPTWRRHKLWGVYPHKVRDREHPLVHGMNTTFDAPHSRYSEITRPQFEKAGMKILAETPGGHVHLATSPDGFRMICMQAHPEYDIFSLLKEYKREITNFINGEREDYPQFPKNYFGPIAQEKLGEYRNLVLAEGKEPYPFPEDDIIPLLENTWADSARSFISSWIGYVYQTTDMDRRKPFMDGIDPDNPLNL